MLPAGSSCSPFLKIHFEVLYLAFSLGIVFLHHEGVSNPAELCFQNYYFAIIWENVLFLILSCYCPFVITQRCCVLQFIILYSIILAHTYFNENSVLAQKSLSLEDHQSGCLDTVHPLWMLFSSSSSCPTLRLLFWSQTSLLAASPVPSLLPPIPTPQPGNSAGPTQQMGSLLLFLFPL